MILNLVSANDPILRETIPNVDFNKITFEERVKIYTDLAETMLHYNGIGLSANQVGLRYKAFVIRTDPVMIMFNPVIVDVSHNTLIKLEERCLSYPGIETIINRPKIIKVRYTTVENETIISTFADMTARIILHEYDHLHGINICTHLTPLKKEMLIKKAKNQGYEYTLKDFAFPII